MMISFTKQVLVPADTLMQELEGESVFLNINNGKYFGLDEVGTRMWKALTISKTIEEAYELLLAEYDVEAETLRHDLEELLEKLVEQGLVEVKRE